MSLKKTKDQLVKLLDDADNKVIALSGKWGTGKTYLWNEIKNESKEDPVKKALYVSLFGQSSIDQTKRKLIEGVVTGTESHSKWLQSLKNLLTTSINALSTRYEALAALNDLNVLLMAPFLLKDKVIVIDDVERKHEQLGIDEILGFIDEYSKQYNVRFILVLNDDELTSQGQQQELWTTFREKVIDQEIRLLTSAGEAFSIAIKAAPSKYAKSIEKAVLSCYLTNIRIITKIIRVANQILAKYDLEEAMQARVVPSIVLLSAIHYRGLEDGPDFQFVLNTGDSIWEILDEDEIKKPTSQEQQEGRWRLLMQELGIHGCDDFEKLLVEFLESGLFDSAGIQVVINRYVTEKEAMEAKQAAYQFLKRAYWDPYADEEQLVAVAATFPACAGLLDPIIATNLNSTLTQLPDGAEIGEAIVDGWIAAFRADQAATWNYDADIHRPLHPKIQAVFAEMKAKIEASTTVEDVCLSIIEDSGWGALQEAVMRRATAADFEQAIRKMRDMDQFSRFMRRMIEMRLQPETYDPHFGTATVRFVEACRAIANDTNGSRLAKVIRSMFGSTTLASELDLDMPVNGVAPPKS